ncbi:hypothetical protein X736_12150 [Mesorhizobium sp. L2C089B000]|nr:hypothetical protein X736_12150 [Mesorhizobium sp. L2C089B000]
MSRRRAALGVDQQPVGGVAQTCRQIAIDAQFRRSEIVRLFDDSPVAVEAEIAQIGFDAIDKCSGLPVVTGLNAAEEAVGIDVMGLTKLLMKKESVWSTASPRPQP